MSLWPTLQLSVSGVALMFATITDVRTNKIPNVLTVPLFIAALVLTVIFEPASLIQSSAAAFGFLVLGLMGGVGGGDAKLLMGLAILNGWKVALLAFVVSLTAMVIFIMLRHKRGALQEAKKAAETVFAIGRKQEPSEKLSAPLAPFLAFGYVTGVLLTKVGRVL